jgi:plastocyanin
MVHARYAIGPTQAGVTDIKVRLSGYSPDAIEVPAGTTVTWTFDDNIAHDVRADAFQSPSFEHGTFTHTFDVAGTYEYHCSFHPIMRGRVVVR